MSDVRVTRKLTMQHQLSTVISCREEREELDESFSKHELQPEVRP